MSKMKRREFIKVIGAVSGALAVWPLIVSEAQAANGPKDKPSGAEFGGFISKTVQAFGITGAQAIAIFGGTPSGRTWAQISDDGKVVMRNFPKQ